MERAETRRRQKRLQEEWGGLRRGCRGPRPVSTTPNPRDTHTHVHKLSFSLSHPSLFLGVRDGIDTNDFQALPHAYMSACPSFSRFVCLAPSPARRLVTAGRVHGLPKTSADLRSRRLGSLMALVGSRGVRDNRASPLGRTSE